MPRIYYRTKKRTQEEAFESEIINMDNFRKILQHQPFLSDEKRRIMITLPQNQGFSLFRKSPKSFKHAVVWGSELNHNTNEYGDFFLPKAIVLFDGKDAYFPSRYYFVALVDGRLDVCECRAGEDTMWFQQAEMHNQVADEKDFHRIEKSIEELLTIISGKQK